MGYCTFDSINYYLMKNILLLLLTVALVSCGKGKLDNGENAFGRYVSSSDSIVYIGSASLGTLLEKSNYKDEPKLKAIIEEMVTNIGKAIKLDKKVYFALQGSLDNSSFNAALFFDINNEKDFSTYLKKNGFEIKKSANINYAIDDKQFIYFTDKYGVMYFQGRRSTSFDEKSVLAFEKRLQDASKSSSTFTDYVDAKGDIVLVGNMYALLHTNKTDLTKLDQKVQDKLYDLYKDAYSQIVLTSENGYLDVRMKNYGAKEIKKFFKTSSSSVDLTKMGAGNALAGLSLNYDTKLLSEFVNTYLPGVFEEALASIDKSILAAYQLADKDLSKFTDGHFAMTVTGDASKLIMGVMPQLNFYMGYGSMGGNFNAMIEPELAKKEFKTLDLTSKYLKISTGENAFSASAKTIYPSFVKDFGKHPFSLFVDFQKIGLDSFGGYVAPLSAIKYMYATGDFEETTLRIYMTDDKKNFLESALQMGLKISEGLMNPYGDQEYEEYDELEEFDYEDEGDY